MFWIILIIVLVVILSQFSKNNSREQIKLKQSSVERLRKCPSCAERVQIEAKKCRYCQEPLLEVSEMELEEIESDYIRRIESFDLDAISKNKERSRRSKNKTDWKNNT